jgi:hypothetical protein
MVEICDHKSSGFQLAGKRIDCGRRAGVAGRLGAKSYEKQLPALSYYYMILEWGNILFR